MCKQYESAGVYMKTEFATVYEQNYEKMYKLAYRLTSSHEEAEDVLQDSFLNAYKAYPDFQSKSLVSTWLYRIVVNCARGNMKKLKRLPVYDIAPRFGMDKDAFFEKLKTYDSVENEVLIASMREECLQLFLRCMPTKQRTAFVLKILLELSSEEVARIMETSVGAVKNHVYRARLRMKENMEDKCSYINPNSPCQCKNWVAYAIENNKLSMIPDLKLTIDPEYSKIFYKDMDFLKKLSLMYSVYPEKMPYQSFSRQMKEIIDKKTLKIFA